jgi:uncharacterized membrane protein
MGDERLRWLRGRRGFITALLLITVVGAVLRLIAAKESLAFDELYLYSWVHSHGFGRMLNLVADNEKTPPLGFIFAWVSGQFGNSPELIRLPSVIAAVALVPATGFLGRRTVGAVAGLLGALLLAVSPFAVFYGSEARSYSLAAFFVVLSVVLLLKALEGSGARWWVCSSLASAAAVMSHYTAAAVLITAMIWALLSHRDKIKAIAAAQIVPLVAIAAWLPWLTKQVANSSDELHRIAAAAPLTPQTLGQMMQRLLIGHPLTDWTRVPGKLSTLSICTGLLIVLIALAIGWVKTGDSVEQSKVSLKTWLLAAMAAAAPIAALVVSLQPGQSMLLARNLLVSLPALLLLAALGITRLRPALAWLAAALIVGGLLAGSVTALPSASRPAIADAARVINGNWKPDDSVIDLCCLYGDSGPLGRELAINLKAGPRSKLALVTADPNIWQRLTQKPARVFIVGYRASRGGPILFDNAPTQWRRSYREVSSRSWPGLLETILREYEPINGAKR